MGAQHRSHSSPGSQAKRAQRWPKEEYVRRVEYDAKNDALLQTIRADIAGMRSEMRTELSAMRVQMESRFSALTVEICAVRSEMRAEVGELKGEIKGLKGEIGGIKTSINVIMGVLALLAGMGALQLHPVIRAMSAAAPAQKALAMYTVPAPMTPASAP